MRTAEAFAPTVRVDDILPGSFRTNASRSWTPDQLDASLIPVGRIGEPAEIGELAVYLASCASSYTTGSLIKVDGGVSRHV